MPLWFVSRERYNEKLAENAELKAELKALRSAPTPVAVEREMSKELQQRMESLAGSGVVQMRPKLTLSSVMQKGTMEASAAFRAGAESPSAVLDRAQRRARTTALAAAKPPTEEAS